jgi:hypothetical protein
MKIVLGGLLVNVHAAGHTRFEGSNPAEGDGFLKDDKNP